MDPVTLPLTGGCACKAVRFAMNGPPLLVYACHCHDCQARSGSAFSLTVVVETADFELSGAVEILMSEQSTGRELVRRRCSACGGAVASHATSAPDYSSLRAGTFDDTRWMVPAAQAFVESAIPWAVIPGVPAVEWPTFDYHAWGETWRANAPAFVAPDQAGS